MGLVPALDGRSRFGAILRSSQALVLTDYIVAENGFGSGVKGRRGSGNVAMMTHRYNNLYITRQCAELNQTVQETGARRMQGQALTVRIRLDVLNRPRSDPLTVSLWTDGVVLVTGAV